jgi:hypothetical protein
LRVINCICEIQSCGIDRIESKVLVIIGGEWDIKNTQKEKKRKKMNGWKMKINEKSNKKRKKGLQEVIQTTGVEFKKKKKVFLEKVKKQQFREMNEAKKSHEQIQYYMDQCLTGQ